MYECFFIASNRGIDFAKIEDSKLLITTLPKNADNGILYRALSYKI